MNEPVLGQEDMTVAESILPVLNLANAQGQEKAGDVYKRQTIY